MAKSMRSKFKRKMRGIRRKRLAVRELKKLEATVSKLNANEGIIFSYALNSALVLCRMDFVFCVMLANRYLFSYGSSQARSPHIFAMTMVNSSVIEILVRFKVAVVFCMDTGKVGNINLKTMQKKDGSYPVWVSRRKIRKMKKIRKITAIAKSRNRRRKH
ncbi:unnamed protein product [Enterobius vermicularis]|uniref:50S ribosomal protein L18 n=1 Tax=Enterobius vermicularis TaxID=51028 RepID=A0A0N4VPE0_ENTVE|nr:unnamed protein product [Enterobius vermicularis]